MKKLDLMNFAAILAVMTSVSFSGCITVSLPPELAAELGPPTAPPTAAPSGQTGPTGPVASQQTGNGGGGTGQTDGEELPPNDLDVPAEINLTAPVSSGANPSFPAGSTIAIRWTSSGDVGPVQIDLLYDTSAFGNPDLATRVDRQISSSTPDDGTYDWVVPAGQHANSDYFVRVSSVADPDVSDTSREISVGG